MQQIIKPQKFTGQANMAHGKNHSKQFQSPQTLETKTNSLHSLHAPRSITNASHIPKTSLFQKTNRQKTYVPQKPIFHKKPIVGIPENASPKTFAPDNEFPETKWAIYEAQHRTSMNTMLRISKFPLGGQRVANHWGKG